MNYYTHSFKCNDEVFLSVRKYLLNLNLKEHPGLDISKEKRIYFGLPKSRLSQINTYDLPQIIHFFEVKECLLSLLVCLQENKEENKILDSTKADKNKIVNLTKDVFDKMGYEHSVWKSGKKKTETLTHQHVFDFYKNLAKVRTTVFESFIFSRMFYVFYFCTTFVDMSEDGKEIKHDKRFKKTAEVFTRHFTNAYKDPSNAKKLNKFKQWFKDFYTPKGKDDSIPEVDEKLTAKMIDAMKQ